MLVTYKRFGDDRYFRREVLGGDIKQRVFHLDGDFDDWESIELVSLESGRKFDDITLNVQYHSGVAENIDCISAVICHQPEGGYLRTFSLKDGQDCLVSLKDVFWIMFDDFKKYRVKKETDWPPEGKHRFDARIEAADSSWFLYKNGAADNVEEFEAHIRDACKKYREPVIYYVFDRATDEELARGLVGGNDDI